MLFAIAILLALALNASAQPEVEWQRSYRWGVSYTLARTITSCSDGGFLIGGGADTAGWANSAVVKVSGNGDSLWSRVYESSAFIHDMIELEDGSIVMIGGDFGISRIDEFGNLMWYREYDMSNTAGQVVISTRDGGLLAVGCHEITYGDPGDVDIGILRLNSDGDSLWGQIFGDDVFLYQAWDVIETGSGEIVIAGSMFGMPALIMKLNAQGELLWFATISGGSFSELLELPDGHFMAFGTYGDYPSYQGWVCELDAEGFLIRQRNYGGPRTETLYAAVCVHDGYIATGSTYSLGEFGAPPLHPNVWIVKLDEELDSVWSIVMGDTNFDWAEDITLTDDGGVAVTGRFDGDRAAYWAARIATELGADSPKPEFVARAIMIAETFPNPFNLVSKIAFDLANSAHVTLTVFDVNGRRVATLADAVMAAGSHSRVFDGHGIASGVYLYRLEAGKESRSGKMVLLK